MIFPPLRALKFLAELLDLSFLVRFILGVLLLVAVFALVAWLTGTTPSRLIHADLREIERTYHILFWRLSAIVRAGFFRQ